MSDVEDTLPPPTTVEAAYASYAPEMRQALLELRSLILDTAAETDGVGRIGEALKWGQPSFLTPETKSGSTVRIAPINATPGNDSAQQYGLFFICHTKLVDRFEDLFGDTFTYEGGRALVFEVGDTLPVNELRECIAMALTYHLGTV